MYPFPIRSSLWKQWESVNLIGMYLYSVYVSHNIHGCVFLLPFLPSFLPSSLPCLSKLSSFPPWQYQLPGSYQEEAQHFQCVLGPHYLIKKYSKIWEWTADIIYQFPSKYFQVTSSSMESFSPWSTFRESIIKPGRYVYPHRPRANHNFNKNWKYDPQYKDYASPGCSNASFSRYGIQQDTYILECEEHALFSSVYFS